MSFLRLPVVASALFVCMFGCASAAHPAPAGDPGGGDDEQSATDEAALAAGTTLTCVPFSRRSCHNYYTTADGHQHCPESFEVCHADGQSYGACGDLSIGASESSDSGASE